jgi:hypothetical protein
VSKAFLYERRWRCLTVYKVAERQISPMYFRLNGGCHREDNFDFFKLLMCFPNRLSDNLQTHTTIEALHHYPYPAKQRLLELIDHYQRGRFSDAPRLAEHFTKKFPRDTFGWRILSTVYRKNGLKLKAISAAKKSSQIVAKRFRSP